MSNTEITEQQKEVNRLIAQNASIDDQRKALEQQKIDLLDEILVIRGAVDAATEDRDTAFYEENRTRYNDADLEDLILRGTTSFTGKIGEIAEYQISNLSKKDSLKIDKMLKSLKDEANTYGEQYIRVNILARALRRYGPVGQMVSMPPKSGEALEVIQELSDGVIAILWDAYIKYARWIQCALKVQLKNS